MIMTGIALRCGIAVGMALGSQDWNGSYRLLISVAATQVATSVLKETAQKLRPNNQAFVGVKVYFQSAAGSVTSNGGEVLVGNR